MRKGLLLPSFFLFGIVSCTTTTTLFGSKNLHDAYGKKITDAGLKQTAIGEQWFAAAKKALAQPNTVTLPYKETGYFPADKPIAVGLQFAVKRGEKLLITVEKRAPAPIAVYTDLWEASGTTKPSLAVSFDTAKNSYSYEVKKTENLIIRLQPELLRSGNYTISITTGPSLHFPVTEKSAHIGSYFGDQRDAGKRQHEGVDIFAPFRTPAIATSDGTVTRVTENELGGKVVFFQPQGKDYTLYYAHLDQQLVTDGQQVKQGDTLGLVGNTGNAKTTPSHLHFGIYTFSGAIDPLPFIDPIVKTPPEIKAATTTLYEANRVNNTTTNNGVIIKPNTIVYPVAAMDNSYRVELPDSQLVVIAANSIQPALRPIKHIKAKQAEAVLESPTMASPVITTLPLNTDISVLGYYDRNTYINAGAISGWILEENKALTSHINH